MSDFKFKARVWVYPGFAAWRFLSIPKTESKKIKTMFGGLARGFGSLKVEATIGKSTWKTSIFPDSKRGVYLLPLKAVVRKAEGIQDGKLVECRIMFIDS